MTNSTPEIPSLTTCNHLTKNSIFNAVVVSIYLHPKGLTSSTSMLFSYFLHIKIKAKTWHLLLQVVKTLLLTCKTLQKSWLWNNILFFIIFQNFLSISTLTLIKYFDWKKKWVHFFLRNLLMQHNMFRRAYHLSENTVSFHKADQQIGFYVMTSIRFEAWRKINLKFHWG